MTLILFMSVYASVSLGAYAALLEKGYRELPANLMSWGWPFSALALLSRKFFSVVS